MFKASPILVTYDRHTIAASADGSVIVAEGNSIDELGHYKLPVCTKTTDVLKDDG